MFRKRAPFEKNSRSNPVTFPVLERVTFGPWKFGPLEVRNIFCFLLNWALFEKIVGKIRWIFSFWREHFGPLKVLVPSPLPHIWIYFCSPVLGGFWYDLKRSNWTSFDSERPEKSYGLCREPLSQLAARLSWGLHPPRAFYDGENSVCGRGFKTEDGQMVFVRCLWNKES